MSKGKVPFKKIISIICTALTVILIAMAVFVIANMIYCRAKNKPVSFFGTSFAIVQTNSMEPYIMTGDLIVFHKCSFEDVEVGDYIVFVADESFGGLKGQSVVHAVKEKTEEGIITQGLNKITNPGPDKNPVTTDNFLGICTFNSAGWGSFFRFIGKYWIIFIVVFVAIPIIVRQIIKIVKLSKNKEGGESAASVGGGTEEATLQEQNSDKDNEQGGKE